MSLVKMISEEEAQGKVKEIYEEIRSSLGIDFVPNMYKVMAVKPDFLEANWQKVNEAFPHHAGVDNIEANAYW